MFRITKFTYNYEDMTRPSYDELIQETDDRLIPLGFIKESIGISEDGEYTIYGYKYGDFSKPTFFIQSNIHGTEWRTPYYCMDFLERLLTLDFYDKKAIRNLRGAFSWYYIPSINPYGFDNRFYYNVNGVNLNRNYDNRWDAYNGDNQWEGNNYKGSAVWSESEARVSRDKILEIKPYLFLDCHTTTGGGNGVDNQHRYRWNRMMMLDILESSKVSMKGASTLEWATQFSPHAGAWAGLQTSKEGTRTISTILEAQSDTDEYNYGLTILFIIGFTVLNFYKNGKLKLNSLTEIKS